MKILHEINNFLEQYNSLTQTQEEIKTLNIPTLRVEFFPPKKMCLRPKPQGLGTRLDLENVEAVVHEDAVTRARRGGGEALRAVTSSRHAKSQTRGHGP